MTPMPIRRTALALTLLGISACSDGGGGARDGSAAVTPSTDSDLARAMARINDPDREASLPTEDNSAVNINPFRRNWGRAGRDAGEVELANARTEGTQAYADRVFSEAEATFAGNADAANQSVSPQFVRRAVACAALGKAQAVADLITPFEGETLASGWMQAFWTENARINERNKTRRLTIQPLISPAEVYALYQISLENLQSSEVVAAPDLVASCQADLAAATAASAQPEAPAQSPAATPSEPRAGE